MSVRVNLLPQATRERGRATQQRNGLLAAGLLLLLVLAGLNWWKADQVGQAEVELAAEQERLTELQGELAQLREFEDLERRRDEVDELLAAALGDELGLAGVLQDLAVVFPADTQLDQLTINASTDANDPSSVGGFTISAETLNNHAPGVERFLLELDKAEAFRQLFVSNSSLSDPELPHARFSADGRLSSTVLTQRYAEGLPEGLR
jgi:Tfp pilus assembly protein PilN